MEKEMEEEIFAGLRQLFQQHFGTAAGCITPLPVSGSSRRYFRMQSGKQSGKHTAIGVYNTDRKENEAFLSFTRHFLSKGLCVPGILEEDLTQNIYLEEDLGDTTLFSYLSAKGCIDEEVKHYYRQALESLLDFSDIVKINKGVIYEAS